MRKVQLVCAALLALCFAVGSAQAQTSSPQVGQTAPTAPTSERAVPPPVAPAAPVPAASPDRTTSQAQPQGECSEASSSAAQLAKLQDDVAAIREAMAKLLASERRKAQHAAWVSGMEVRRSNDHLGRVTGLMVAGALATGLFSWAMVKRDYATAPVIMTSLSAVLTTAAAVKFGKLIYTRRAITREIQAASR